MHAMNKTRTPSYAWELEREARTPRNGWNAGAQFAKPAPRRVKLRNEAPSLGARVWRVLNTPIFELIFSA